MSTPGTLGRVAYHLVRAVEPLADAFSDAETFQALMLQLGWQAPGLPPEYLIVAERVTQASAALASLTDGASVGEILAVIDKAGAVYRAVDALTAAPDGIDPAVFLPELARRLFELVLGQQLRAEAPGWYATLEALGIISLEDHPPAGDRPGFSRIRVDWDQIPAILSDPALIPALVYGWGTPDLDFPKIADLLGEAFLAIGLASSLDRLSDEFADALQAEATGPLAAPVKSGVTLLLFDTPVAASVELVGLLITELPAEGDALPGIVLLPKVPAGIADRVDLGDGWAFTVRAGSDLATQLGVVVRPDGVSVKYPGAPGQPLPRAGFGIALGFTPETPVRLFGQAGGTRLELAAAELHGAIDLAGDDLHLKAGLRIDGLALVIEPDDIDSFLGSAMGGKALRVNLAFGLNWSSRTGLDFVAGAGLQATVYPHLKVGPLRIDSTDLALRLATGDPPVLEAQAAASISGKLGPVSFQVDRLGVRLPVRFADGNAGPFDVRLEPLWPTGLGLAISAGPVVGGGFISFDPDRGRYAGVVALDVFDIGVSAIAVLDTKDAAGKDLPSPGYSFILVVAANLPPIQLGFGFVLRGVGGIAGLNRRLDSDALLAAVRSGTVSSFMFPHDPIRNAPAIVSNLSTIFPIAPGRHVFGPMALIEWGTPALIKLRVGLVVEVPAPVRLALIGTATVELPKDKAVIRLNLDVVGVLDFTLRRLAVDASLRDSYVAGFPLAGDMAMRLSYGPAEKNFALAVGGFNPHFEAPSKFPRLRRVSLMLGSDNPRLNVEGYLAVTSNSLQFGARAELYAAAAGFNVKGWVSFDALMTLVPLWFRFDFSAGMTLNRGSRRIAGITIDGALTGPNPFHAWGKGKLSVLWWDISVPFDVTFGKRQEQPALPAKDPWPELAAAIAQASNWSAGLPPRTVVGVTLRAPENAPQLLLLDPMGAATLRQKAVPFNRTLERFGLFEITGPDRFDISNVLVGGEPAGSWVTVTEHFAPGDFEDLSETDKLNRDSFEAMVAGVTVRAAGFDAPAAEMKTADVVYETKIIDAPWRSRTLPRFPADRDVQVAFSRTGSVATASGTAGTRGRFAGGQRDPGVVLAPERYAVATTDTLAVPDDLLSGITRGEAYLARKRARDVRGVQVVPVHELEVG